MKNESRHSLDTIFTALLICAFAACVLFVLIFATRIYSTMTEAADKAYQERTVFSFVAQKLRQADAKGAVYVGDFDGENALYLESLSEDGSYHSILYSYEGWLYELFCEKEASFFKGDGAKILPVSRLRFSEEEPGLFYVEAVDMEGGLRGLFVSLRSGGKR